MSAEQDAEERRLARIGVDGLRAEGWTDPAIMLATEPEPETDRAFERQRAEAGIPVAAWRVKRLIREMLTQ